MATLTKNNLFKAYDSKPETAMEKTTRVVKKMVEEDAEKRNAKTSRLRKARLEREASTAPKTTTKGARKPR
ncbi:hypothetical protein [Pseudooceanicola algae]|uniref:Uncharacterized protein n=1 Tax=Pseudooceanicola algae TaxID=1537215 RepID=A0A418SLE8_9RHOB|nr:hypothetical protein [Pseudooceanicola algae]QPM90567.1 hypothetical protein PSAL_018060 [Pseudooceanicola algae]